MTLEQFEYASRELSATALDIQVAKRPAYTGGNVDVLHNFKTVAARVGVTPQQVWAVYWLKHVDAILSAMARPDLPQAEAVIGRFADSRNYEDLGWALFKEREAAG